MLPARSSTALAGRAALPLRWLGSLALVCVAAGARAEGERAHEEEPRAATLPAAPAKLHFDEALAHYRLGHYRAAVAELKASLTFDPTSKDLLYNLALVHEKLGELDLAIAALERYAELETDPKELDRARQARERMRGARAELAVPVLPPRLPVPPPALPLPEHRVSPWFVATAALAATAGIVGAVFGVRALVLSPGDSASTDAKNGISDLEDRQHRAETSALIADVSFAVGLASGAAATALWLREPPSCPRVQGAAQPSLGLRWGARF